MVTPELKDEDIDRIWKRLNRQIDLKNIKSGSQLRSAVLSLPKVRSWNAGINEVFWDIRDKGVTIENEAVTTFDFDRLYKLEQDADSLDYGSDITLKFVRDQLERATRDIRLPRLPSQGEIKRTSEYSSIFADLIEEIASDKGLKAANESEWNSLSGNERGQISREITRRLAGR